MPAPPDILALVEKFELNREAYLSGTYNETQARREFIDPLFVALGWDVENRQGHAEAYKDVIHEDQIKIGGTSKAPDYCFRIGGTRKFFVEAKKPSVDVKGDIQPAFQVRRYAWSAKLSLSVLTDFEEFAVYDCRMKPTSIDKASVARVIYMTCREYAQRWDEIASIFHRDSILKGSFDRYAESNKEKRGTTPVDASFLDDIEEWRAQLARNIALRNEGTTQLELNFSVQRIIDRIIFLRICEDRGIEARPSLMALLNGTNTYARMLDMFRQADDRYNSGLFHFRSERGRAETVDTLTPKPDTSKPHPEHPVFPYLLRNLAISQSNQVWATDITYIPMAHGFAYLVAIIDWYSRRVLAWRLSNTLESSFCVEALQEALANFPKPTIFNTDQGSQFTAEAFTSVLRGAGITISMDGRGRCIDNVFVERVWRSLKYEEVFLHAYEDLDEARAGIGRYFEFYNLVRPHQALGYQTPDAFYRGLTLTAA